MGYGQSPQLKEFNRIYKEADDMYHNLALRLGMSDSTLDILYTICVMGDGCLQRDVCSLCCTRKQTVNSAIRKLEREGILTLTRGRGRDMHIVLTALGKQTVEEKIQPLLEAEERAFARISPQEQAQLLALNRNYFRQLQEEIEQLK